MRTSLFIITSILTLLQFILLSCTTTREVDRHESKPLEISIKIDGDIFHASVNRKVVKYKVYESDDLNIHNKEVPSSKMIETESVKYYSAEIELRKKYSGADILRLTVFPEGVIREPLDNILKYLEYANSDVEIFFTFYLHVRPETALPVKKYVILENHNEVLDNPTYKIIKMKQTKEITIINKKLKAIESIKIDNIINIGQFNRLKVKIENQKKREKNEDVLQELSSKIAEIDQRIYDIKIEAEEKRAERIRIAEEKKAERARIAEEKRAERARLNQPCTGSWNQKFICECSKECLRRNRPCDDDIHRITNLWRFGVDALLPGHVRELRKLCPRTSNRFGL